MSSPLGHESCNPEPEGRAEDDRNNAFRGPPPCVGLLRVGADEDQVDDPITIRVVIGDTLTSSHPKSEIEAPALLSDKPVVGLVFVRYAGQGRPTAEVEEHHLGLLAAEDQDVGSTV